MTYFELYDLPISLKIDAIQLKQKFYELSRKFHPDFFSQASENEQVDALEKSALINKAFKIFSKEDLTIQYVLQLKGLLEEDEKYQLAPNFLMEVMELNEQLMEAKMEDNVTKIAQLKSEILNLQSSIYEPVKAIVEHYQEAVTTQEALLQVKEYYYRKKYLARILDSLG
jgi:molecular chaperone HscB